MIAVFGILLLICLTFVILNAMRKKWKNAIISVLCEIIVVLLFIMFVQSLTCAHHRAKLQTHDRIVADLEKQLKEASSKPLHATSQ